MTPPGVVPAFNPGEHCQSGLGTGFEVLAIDQFAFQASKEALRHGIIKGITDCSHGRAYTHLAAAVAEGQAGVLTSLVAMMNDLFGAALLVLMLPLLPRIRRG